MYLTLHVDAFDVLERVHVTLRVRSLDSEHDRLSTTLVERSVTFSGTGEDDPGTWARDALVALIEAL
jgi:hypothetical protein